MRAPAVTGILPVNPCKTPKRGYANISLDPESNVFVSYILRLPMNVRNRQKNDKAWSMRLAPGFRISQYIIAITYHSPNDPSRCGSEKLSRSALSQLNNSTGFELFPIGVFPVGSAIKLNVVSRDWGSNRSRLTWFHVMERGQCSQVEIASGISARVDQVPYYSMSLDPIFRL